MIDFEFCDQLQCVSDIFARTDDLKQKVIFCSPNENSDGD